MCDDLAAGEICIRCVQMQCLPCLSCYRMCANAMPPLPFLPSDAQRAAAHKRARSVFSEGVLSPAVRSSNIQWWVSSWLKSHDWQMTAGMIAAYLLHGFLGQRVQAAIFRCIA